MDVVHKISVDFGKEQIPQRISVMQNDSARKIEVSLYENGAVWNVPDGTSAYLAFRRPDGKNIKSISLEGGSPVVTFNENVATIQIPPELTFIDGDVPAVVVFVDANEKQIATFPTWVQVRENPSVESADDETIAPDQLTQILSAIASLKATVVQQSPLFANSIEECTDTTKPYVLPDGYIYAYTLGGGYTNLVPTSTDADGSVFNGAGYQDNSYLNYPDSTIATKSGFTVTGFIPFTWTDVLRMSGVTWNNSAQSCIDFYDENKKPMGNYLGSGYVNTAKAPYTSEGRNVMCLAGKGSQSVTVEDGVTTFNLTFYDHDIELDNGGLSAAGYRVKYVRISAQGVGEDMVVTLNEEIAGNGPAGYAWRNTGHAFVPADYEDRIVALENEMDEAQQTVTTLQQEVQELRDEIPELAALATTDYKYAASKVLCIGDSLTSGYYAIEAGPLGGNDIAQSYPYFLSRILNCKVTNAGTTGYSASDWYNKEVAAHSYSAYDTIIVWLGTNYGCVSMPTDEEIAAFVPDSSAQASTANQALYLAKIIQRIQEVNNSCHIVLCTVFGSKTGVAENNAVVQQLAAKYGCQLVDMSDLSSSKHPELHANILNPHFGKMGNLFVATRLANAISNYIDEDLAKGEFGVTIATPADGDENGFDPLQYGIPVLQMTGNTKGISKDNAVSLSYTYGELRGSCTLKWQGSSSIVWPKKNYTIKFKDGPVTIKNEWGAQQKYCLKANFIDFSHSRNLVSAKLWGQVVKSRDNGDARLTALVNAGAVDGFPIGLFINGEYQGIYTFNIPKDGWMFGMGSGANEAIVCAEGPTADTSAVKFRKADVRLSGNEKDFDIEYVPDEDNDGWVKTSLDRMIAACINSDGTDLDTTVAQYLDWDSVIDYIIFTTLQNGFDGLYKNYLLATYDGTKWFFSAYDMDSTYGLLANGQNFCKTDEPYDNRASIGVFCEKNRAMELVKLYKKDALKARYAELRAGILSEDNVATTFANFIGSIPKALYDKECTIWKSLPSTATNNLAQITDFYRRKCAAIDAEIAAL